MKCTAFAAAAMIAICGWFAFHPAEASPISDDGVYAVHAARWNQAQDFSVPHLLADTDEIGAAYPYLGSAVSDRGFFPAVRHVPWALALAPFESFGGAVGMRIALGLAFAACIAATGWLASSIADRSAVALSMALAFGSPLLFHGLQLWAHVPAAAATAVALGATARIGDGNAKRSTIAIAYVSCLVAGLLRADGAIFAGSAGLALALRRRKDARGIVLGLSVCATAVAAHLGVLAFGAAAEGSSAAAQVEPRGSGSLEWRWKGFLYSVYGAGVGGRSGWLAGIALAIVAVAALLVRRRLIVVGAVLVGTAALVWLVRLVEFPSVFVSGLVGAWPVCLFGLFRRSALTERERQVLVGIGLGACVVMLVQYDYGGGLDWGGRYLLPAVPPLSVLAAVGLREVNAVASGDRLGMAATALVLVLGAAMLTFDDEARASTARVLAPLSEDASDLPHIAGQGHLPRYDWEAYPDRQWLSIPPAEMGGVRLLRELLLEAGYEEVVAYLIRGRDAAALGGRRSLPGVRPDELLLEPRVVPLT